MLRMRLFKKKEEMTVFDDEILVEMKKFFSNVYRQILQIMEEFSDDKISLSEAKSRIIALNQNILQKKPIF